MPVTSQNETHELKDSFQRKIDYLRISITDRCNLKCVYCTPEKGPKHFDSAEILTFDEITRFVRIAHKNGLNKVRITGGEPLLRKDIVSLVSSIKQLGVRNLSITTNGMMLAALAGPLKSAGLDRVNISLDTLKAERFGKIAGGGNIEKIWEAIAECERLGLAPIKINVVPIAGVNDDEIVEFAALTMHKDYHIRFIELMPLNRKCMRNNTNSIKNSELMQRISSLGELQRLEFKGRGPSRNYKLKGAKGVIGFISPLSDCFCETCNRLRLTAHGRIRPCLFSNIEVDVKTAMRQGCSDEELQSLLFQAVADKPEGNYLSSEERLNTDLVSMAKIGG